MTQNLCVDGVTIDDTLTLKVCVDGAPAEVCVDGTIVYDLALAPPIITTSTSLDAFNDNDGDITNGTAITAWTPTNTGGAVTAYSIVAGALPTGLSLNAATGAITGTPTVDGTYNWTVRATNADGTSDFADSIVVAAAGVPPNITTSVAFPAATIGTAFNWTPTNTGGAATSYSIVSGTLPAGLAFNTTTGAITGTPTTAGTANIIVRATNAFGTSDFAGTITVTAAATAGNVVFPFSVKQIGMKGAADQGGVTFFPDGHWEANTESPPALAMAATTGTWADDSPATSGALFEVMFDYSSGQGTELTDFRLNNVAYASGTWVPISANRSFTFRPANTAASFFGSFNVDFVVREIANPANTATGSWSYSYAP